MEPEIESFTTWIWSEDTCGLRPHHSVMSIELDRHNKQITGLLAWHYINYPRSSHNFKFLGIIFSGTAQCFLAQIVMPRPPCRLLWLLAYFCLSSPLPSSRVPLIESSHDAISWFLMALTWSETDSIYIQCIDANFLSLFLLYYTHSYYPLF